LCQLPPDRPIAEALHDVVMEIDRRLAQECEPAQAVRLMTAAFILTGLRVDREAIAPIFSGVRVMHESTAFDYYVEEGLKKGLEQGLTKGLEQGREQGLIQGQRRQLLSIGRKLLDEPNDATIAALQAINDADRLERMALAILTATSWQELLGTP
jgi:pyruvate-formate lyase